MHQKHQARRPARFRAASLPQAGDRRAALLTALVTLASLGLAGPAHPQWREGATANPATTLDTRADNLGGYAQMVDTWGDRLGRAVREVQAEAPTDTGDGTMSRPRMHLLDTAQTAWTVIRHVPDGFAGREAFEAADRQFETSLTAMRVASTPTSQALAEARKILAALERLEAAAVEAARTAAR